MKRAMLYFTVPVAIAVALGVLADYRSTRMSQVGSAGSEVSAPASRIEDQSDAAGPRPQSADEWLRARLLNIPLTTHENKPVRFYDDLVKDKIVLINFMFTNCEHICLPMTANLVRVQELLGDHVGRDIFMLSITLDSEYDTPEVLKDFAELHRVTAGWFFLTGEYEDIERLRRNLGIYDPDPVIDADKEQHAGLLTFGNERTGRWAALPALMKPEQIVEAVLRITDPNKGRHSSPEDIPDSTH